MYKLCSFFLIVASFSCNNSNDNSKPASSVGAKSDKVKALVGTNWNIPNDVADKMKKYLSGCSSDCRSGTNIINYNDAVFKAIGTVYGEENVEWVSARYTDDDESRYCSTRGFLGQKDKCDVGGYPTQIVRAISIDNSNITYTYFDIVTICPPPEGETPGSCKEMPADTTGGGGDSTRLMKK